MTLQSSGAISIDDIVAEFGGTSPDGLDEYYRGGTYVPDISVNSGVPTSGTISLEDFYGAEAEDVTPDSMTFSPVTLGAGTTTSNDTITGINTSINIEFSYILLAGTVDVRINSGSWTAVTGQQISISNNDFIELRFNDTEESGTQSFNGTVSLVNKSDGDTTLVTLSCNSYGAGGI